MAPFGREPSWESLKFPRAGCRGADGMVCAFWTSPLTPRAHLRGDEETRKESLHLPKATPGEAEAGRTALSTRPALWTPAEQMQDHPLVTQGPAER